MGGPEISVQICSGPPSTPPLPDVYIPGAYRFDFCFAVAGKPSLASLKEIHTCMNIQSGDMSLFYDISMVISSHKEGADSDRKKQEMSHLDLITTAIKNIPLIQGRTDWGWIDYFSVRKKHVAR